MPHYVSSLAKQMLDYGDWIIQAVKSCAPLGSGNNHSPHSGPCHSSNSTAVVLDGNNLMFKRSNNEWIKNDWNRPMRRAAYVLKFGAGNCQDLAALAYCYCRDYFSDQTSVKYVVNRSFGHAYVIVSLGGETIVVDPWPLNAQAVMVKHHFCGNNYSEVIKNSTGLISTTTGKNTKPSRVLTAYERAHTTWSNPNSNLSCARQYVHKFCSNTGGIIDYKVS